MSHPLLPTDGKNSLLSSSRRLAFERKHPGGLHSLVVFCPGVFQEALVEAEIRVLYIQQAPVSHDASSVAEGSA
jgi:hypothetical protein